jgi:pimeloyl-ACP methyl ester carboxylesterase
MRIEQVDEARKFFLDLNGVRLHCQDWGGSGEPIVLLHATSLVASVYRPIAVALRSIGHVYSYDQRGHGDSSHPADGDYSWARTVDDLRAFIVAMKLEGARGWGHSAGGTAIGSLAGMRPDLISRGVLVEPVVFGDEALESGEARENLLYDRTVKRRRWFESVQAMFDNFEKKPPYDSWRRDMLREYCEAGTRSAFGGGVELKCTPEIEAEYYSRATEYAGLQLILGSDSPMLVMFGDRSDSLGAMVGAKIGARLRKGRVMTIPESGHFMPMERPEEVARIAIEFFNEK